MNVPENEARMFVQFMVLIWALACAAWLCLSYLLLCVDQQTVQVMDTGMDVDAANGSWMGPALEMRESDAKDTIDAACVWVPGSVLLAICCSSCLFGLLLASKRGVYFEWHNVYDGMGTNSRYHHLWQITIWHVLSLPLDVAEVFNSVLVLVMFVTGWRWRALRRDAGEGLTLAGWDRYRSTRYTATLKQFSHWLLDLPAIAMLLVLLVTVIRAWPTLMNLHYWCSPSDEAKRERYTRTQREYKQAQASIRQVTEDQAPDALWSKFPPQQSAAAAQAERRLALAKLVHNRLAEEAIVCELPLESVENIASLAVRPIVHVPRDNPLADDALAAAPPDSTIVLAPGLHRIRLARLRPGITVEGEEGASASDVIVLPIGAVPLAGQQVRTAGTADWTAGTELKNLSVVYEPHTIRRVDLSVGYGALPDTTDELVDQWRTLVWQQAELFLLDLPFPLMSILCLWRIPELCVVLRAQGSLFHDRRLRAKTVLQIWLKVLLDVLLFVPTALMVISLWRIPSLLQAYKWHAKGQSPHRTVFLEFIQWLQVISLQLRICDCENCNFRCISQDMPFAILALLASPVLWRSTFLIQKLCGVGRAYRVSRGIHNRHETHEDADQVLYHNIVSRAQRLITLRYAMMSLLDVMALCMAPPMLAVCPWRVPQFISLFRYERAYALGELAVDRSAVKGIDHVVTTPSPQQNLLEISRWIKGGGVFTTELRQYWGFENNMLAHFLERQYQEVMIDSQGQARISSMVTEPVNRVSSAAPEPSAESSTVDQLDWITNVECLQFAVLQSIVWVLSDLVRLLALPIILVLGIRHIKWMITACAETVRDFRVHQVAKKGAWRWDTAQIVSYTGFVESRQASGIFCGMPNLSQQFSETYIRSYSLPELYGPERELRPGFQRIEERGVARIVLAGGHPAHELLSFKPRVSASMFHWTVDEALCKTIMDIPHILVLPIKLCAVLLFPVYFYLRCRLAKDVNRLAKEAGADAVEADIQPDIESAAAVAEEPVAPTLKPNISLFLVPTQRSWTHAKALTLRNAHIRGFLLIVFLPLCLLDAAAVLLMGASVALFAWPLTLCSPLWEAYRRRIGFSRVGHLPTSQLGSCRGRVLQLSLVLLQVVGFPVYLAWLLLTAAAPLVLARATLDPVPPSDSSGFGRGSDQRFAGWPTDARQVWRDCGETLETVAGEDGQLLLWIIVQLFWLAVVGSACSLVTTYCTRRVPLFTPLRAYQAFGKSFVQGRVWLCFRSLLVRATAWSYAKRTPRYGFAGEFAIPCVVLVWARARPSPVE